MDQIPGRRGERLLRPDGVPVRRLPRRRGHGQRLLDRLPAPSYRTPRVGARCTANGACYGYSPVFAADFWSMFLFPIMMIALFSGTVMLLSDG